MFGIVSESGKSHVIFVTYHLSPFFSQPVTHNLCFAQITMGKKYSHTEVTTQLRITRTIADLVKTVEFLIRVYKIAMIQCAKSGYCPMKAVKWSIAIEMTDMSLVTSNRLFRQFCGAYRLGLYQRDDLHRFMMSDWRATLEENKPQNTSSPYDIPNDDIKTLLIESYPTLPKLLKYKEYDTYFLKRTFDEVFDHVPKRSRVGISSKISKKYIIPTTSIFVTKLTSS